MGYIGVDGIAKKIANLYVGVNGTARKVTKAYVGVDGVAKLWWEQSTGPATTVGVLAKRDTWYKGTTTKSSITTINFDTIAPTTYTETWNADTEGVGLIKCYVNGTDLTIVSSNGGVVKAHSDCYRTFGDFPAVTEIRGLSLFDTSNVQSMIAMFFNCSSLTSLDVSSFNTSKVTNMGQMFCYCKALTSLDVSSFNVSNVTVMEDMFSVCQSLTSLDLSSFDTSKVTDMDRMFDHCPKLASLNLSSFYTSNVTTMERMFSKCYALTTLDLSSFDTNNVTNMSGMFYYCKALTEIYVTEGKWVIGGATDTTIMWNNCPATVIPV